VDKTRGCVSVNQVVNTVPTVFCKVTLTTANTAVQRSNTRTLI